MYNKKYIIEKIEEFNGHNKIYDGVEGKTCYPAYLNVGERGWLLYVENFGVYEYGHKIHTSIVKSIIYTDDKIILETMNTRITFKMM